MPRLLEALGTGPGIVPLSWRRLQGGQRACDLQMVFLPLFPSLFLLLPRASMSRVYRLVMWARNSVSASCHEAQRVSKQVDCTHEHTCVGKPLPPSRYPTHSSSIGIPIPMQRSTCCSKLPGCRNKAHTAWACEREERHPQDDLELLGRIHAAFEYADTEGAWLIDDLVFHWLLVAGAGAGGELIMLPWAGC